MLPGPDEPKRRPADALGERHGLPADGSALGPDILHPPLVFDIPSDWLYVGLHVNDKWHLKRPGIVT